MRSGTDPLSRLRRQLFPFLSPDGDIFPRPGEVFPLRASPWQNRQVSSSFVNDRRSWPVKHKLYASAKASTFGGGGISQSEMTEGVSSGTDPLSRLRRQLFPFLSPDGDIFPPAGGSLSTQGEPLAEPASFVHTGQRQKKSTDKTKNFTPLPKPLPFGRGGTAKP